MSASLVLVSDLRSSQDPDTIVKNIIDIVKNSMTTNCNCEGVHLNTTGSTNLANNFILAQSRQT